MILEDRAKWERQNGNLDRPLWVSVSLPHRAGTIGIILLVYHAKSNKIGIILPKPDN